MANPDAQHWIRSLTLEGQPGQWAHAVGHAHANCRHTSVLGKPLWKWQADDRPAIGLAPETPVIATGHQTLLWHPGILAKYMVVEHLRRNQGYAAVNLVVDQHVNTFGSFEVPRRNSNGALTTKTIKLTSPREDVPMGVHESFTPQLVDVLQQQPLDAGDNQNAEDLQQRLNHVITTIARHNNAPNAAIQMARALSNLMAPWIEPWPMVTATGLLNTTLARAMLSRMRDQPQQAAHAYNRAVNAVPEARIGPLHIRDDYVEIPLWRLRPDGQRMHAWDGDLDRWLDGDPSIILMPRALLLTALIRLVLCDGFVHGTGGGIYDKAMERWLEEWMHIKPAPAFVASATVWMPTTEGRQQHSQPDMRRHAQKLMHRRRHQWHDAGVNDHAFPSSEKKAWLKKIQQATPNSRERRKLFHHMHDELFNMRQSHAHNIDAIENDIATTRQTQHNLAIAHRRDWPFAVYPPHVIDQLNGRVGDAMTADLAPLNHPPFS